MLLVPDHNLSKKDLDQRSPTFWYQGLVSWKTVFLWTRVGGWERVGMVSG